MKLRIMTFNIQHAKNYITKKIDYNEVYEFIKKYNPDIIGLNEVYAKGFDKNISLSQLDKINEKLNYYAVFGKATKIRGIEYGNAILSKYKVDTATTIKIKNPLFRIGKRMYQTRSILKININDLNILITHLGLNKREKINGIKTILENISFDKCIVMGDFNMIESDILLNSIDDNLINTSKYIRGNRYSFPSDKPNRKLDYIYVSKDIKTIKSFIPSDIVSDHRAIITDIEV